MWAPQQESSSTLSNMQEAWVQGHQAQYHAAQLERRRRVDLGGESIPSRGAPKIEHKERECQKTEGQRERQGTRQCQRLWEADLVIPDICTIAIPSCCLPAWPTPNAAMHRASSCAPRQLGIIRKFGNSSSSNCRTCGAGYSSPTRVPGHNERFGGHPGGCQESRSVSL